MTPRRPSIAAQKHPAIVWIRGSGSDQDFLGWHPGGIGCILGLHQYLAQQGYVILTPDYRGSSGYDREWATGEITSISAATICSTSASGADYLKTLGYVDRIGSASGA